MLYRSHVMSIYVCFLSHVCLLYMLPITCNITYICFISHIILIMLSISHVLFIYIHVLFTFCKYVKLWNLTKIRFHPSLSLKLKRMKPEIMGTSKIIMFHPAHNIVVHSASPHNDQYRVREMKVE